MKKTGIVRKIDELGRIVIPQELRNSMDVQTYDKFEIFIDEDKIILKKRKDSCVFCGCESHLIDFRVGEDKKSICKVCMIKIKC